MEESNKKQLTMNPQMQEAMDAIEAAVKGEKEDEMFYDYLISVAPNKEEKDIIKDIRDDERRHNKLFRMIYEDFTTKEVPMDRQVEFERPRSYPEGIRRALFGELGAVERYRDIRRRLPRGIYKDVLFDIITDELKHGSKYNYLYTMNHRRPYDYDKYDYDKYDKDKYDYDKYDHDKYDHDKYDKDKYEKRANTDTSNYTPDEWVKYITPLVDRAMADVKGGMNPEHVYQMAILAGVLIGLGKNPKDAMDQVSQWEKSGVSELLTASKVGRYFY